MKKLLLALLLLAAPLLAFDTAKFAPGLGYTQRIRILYIIDSLYNAGNVNVTGTVKSDSAATRALNVTGQVRLDTINGVVRAMDGAIVQDSLIVGTATTDGGASYPVQVRMDQDGLTIVNVENQTAGSAAGARFRLESNSASGFITVFDDGNTSAIFADRLVAQSSTTASGLVIVAQATGTSVDIYAGGTTAANLELQITPDSSQFFDDVRVDSTLKVQTGLTVGSGGTKLENVQILTGVGNVLMIVMDAGKDTLFFPPPDSVAVH